MAFAAETNAFVSNHPAIWRGGSLAPALGSHPTGFAALDAVLPGGGWPRGALTELLLGAAGIGELRLIVPVLSAITASGAWTAFVAPPYVPYAPALARLGVDLTRMIILEAKALKDRWWAAEQALRGGSLGAVLFWPQTMADRDLRRLQLAAQTGGGIGFVFASADRAGHSYHSSPAPLRLKLCAAGNRLQVEVLKRRGSPVTQPLLLDIGATCEGTPLSLDGRGAGGEGARRFTPPLPVPLPRGQSERCANPRAVSLGAAQEGRKNVWDRAIARADTVKRSASSDGRS